MLLRHREEEISESFPSNEIQRLQEQNTSLRRAVAEMRKEMETLSDQVLPPAQSESQASDTAQPLPKAAAEAAAPGARGVGGSGLGGLSVGPKRASLGVLSMNICFEKLPQSMREASPQRKGS